MYLRDRRFLKANQFMPVMPKTIQVISLTKEIFQKYLEEKRKSETNFELPFKYVLKILLIFNFFS